MADQWREYDDVDDGFSVIARIGFACAWNVYSIKVGDWNELLKYAVDTVKSIGDEMVSAVPFRWIWFDPIYVKCILIPMWQPITYWNGKSFCMRATLWTHKHFASINNFRLFWIFGRTSKFFVDLRKKFCFTLSINRRFWLSIECTWAHWYSTMIK